MRSKARLKCVLMLWLFVFGSVSSLVSGIVFADYSAHPAAKAFTKKMVKDHGFDANEITGWLKQANKQQKIIDAISRPAEKTKEWHEYRDIFIQAKRIDLGVEFWKEHEATLARAEKTFGVNAEIIVAIIGVETYYGKHAGTYRVLDALTTLGFDYPPRAAFFEKQLEEYFLLAREQGVALDSLKGSYAGAMGYGQFIPSSYRAYAVDFDNDGKVDIWNNPVDAIGSVANYFKVHKWQKGQPVFAPAIAANTFDRTLLNSKKKPSSSVKALNEIGFAPRNRNTNQDALAVPLRYVGKQGEEFWLGFENFYCITRYNRSHLYARAVWTLSEEIKQVKNK